MAISELQIALIGAGAAAVALVWGYNGWQSRKHRKTADAIFKSGHGDALLDGQTATAPTAPALAAIDGEPRERREPRLHFADEADDLPEAAADANPAVAVEAPFLDDETGPAPVPAQPVDCADATVDCLLHLVAVDPVPAAVIRAMHDTWREEVTKPVHWLALVDGAWRQVDADDSGGYCEWTFAVQLADRRGPVADGELACFFSRVQAVAQQLDAALELPSRSETVVRAASLDEFCATVDIQFVLHVVEASGGIFAGSKLREVAETADLTLEGDGVFRARDDAGGELFTVASLGAERLHAESIGSLATYGLTLSLDVPRVANGTLAFDRMLATARQLATALGGVLVDAQRAPLSDTVIDAIRLKTAELQQRMAGGGIVAGSPRALRLFS